MSGCNDNGPWDGGDIRNSNIYDSTLYNPEINNPSISGEVELTDSAANSIMDKLCPIIKERGCVEVNSDDVAAVFNDCEGTPRRPGTSIPSCSDVERMIGDAMGSTPMDRITSIAWDSAQENLTISVLFPDGTTGSHTVSFSQFMKNPTPSTQAPATANATAIPTMIVGQRTMFLGQPNAWINLGGVLVPGYTAAP